MRACNGSARMHSPSGSNNQQGVEDTSQTSDNVVNNRSPQTGCCCKPVEVLAGAAPTAPSYHVPACQSKFLHQGGCEVRTPIAQQLRRCPKTAMKHS